MRTMRLLAALIGMMLLLGSTGIASGAEFTIPTPNPITPEAAARYKYVEDGDFTTALKLPTYEWLPVGSQPQVIVLGIHGLTLHGRRYGVIARTCALQGYGFVALDMRGFGRARFDTNKQFSTKEDDKTKVNHEKSYADIVQLTKLIKQKYPNAPVVLMGESLGCTFCVRVASEHPELVSGIVLSAPAVKVNPKMYMTTSNITEGMKAIVRPSGNLKLNTFITQLVSPRPEVVKEMLDDPMVLKEIYIMDLLATDLFVEKTAKWGKTVSQTLPVLILQGGGDSCVVPKSVTDLMCAMPSHDQTLRWLGNYGHLQLETSAVRSITVDFINEWMSDHSTRATAENQIIEKEITAVGGKLVTEQ
jgi:acylglycerol lipase